MTLQAVIFDVDGTLADTEEVHRQAFNATFREFVLLSTTLADLPPATFEVIGAGEQALEKKPAPDIYT